MKNGIVIAVNDAYCKLVGMDTASLEGKPFTIIYDSSEDSQAMLERHREHFLTRGRRTQDRA
ncbi:MAG: PAS domain S-box protein [Limisphaerales bacterium]